MALDALNFTSADKKKYAEFLESRGSEEEATRDFLRYKCVTDLYFLGAEILGMGKALRKGRPLLDVKFHRWLANEMQGAQSSLILVPRGHLKSAWLKVELVQGILTNPFDRTALYSITQGFGEAQLRVVKDLCLTPLLVELFPELLVSSAKQFEKDVRNAFTIRRSDLDGPLVQEAQIEVFGVGNSVTGRHFDRHRYDDLEDKERVRTVELIQKLYEWFSGVQPVLEPGGSELMIGTPYHHSDLYHYIEEEEIFDVVKKRPVTENGKFIYRWFTKRVFKQATRGMTPYDISCQYHINPIPTEDMAFPPPHPTYSVLPEEEYAWYIAVDPAATQNKWSDETAIIVAAVSGEGVVYIVEEFHAKIDGNQIASKIIELCLKYKPRKVGIEFGLQEHLKHIIDNAKSTWEDLNHDKLALYVEPIRISSRHSKFDRVNYTMGSFWRNDKVRVQKGCVGLLAQMGKFNRNYTGKDDLVDAASMIFQLVETFSYRHYLKKEFQYEPKDYFTFEDVFQAPKKKTWDARFVR